MGWPGCRGTRSGDSSRVCALALHDPPRPRDQVSIATEPHDSCTLLWGAFGALLLQLSVGRRCCGGGILTFALRAFRVAVPTVFSFFLGFARNFIFRVSDIPAGLDKPSGSGSQNVRIG